MSCLLSSACPEQQEPPAPAPPAVQEMAQAVADDELAHVRLLCDVLADLSPDQPVVAPASTSQRGAGQGQPALPRVDIGRAFGDAVDQAARLKTGRPLAPPLDAYGRCGRAGRRLLQLRSEAHVCGWRRTTLRRCAPLHAATRSSCWPPSCWLTWSPRPTRCAGHGVPAARTERQTPCAFGGHVCE